MRAVLAFLTFLSLATNYGPVMGHENVTNHPDHHIDSDQHHDSDHQYISDHEHAFGEYWAGNETQLYHDTFGHGDYEKAVRPAMNATSPVTVNFGLSLVKLISVDQVKHTIEMGMWLKMIWKDFRLKWDPKDYGGITSLRVDVDKLWMPDIVMFNSASANTKVFNAQVMVQSDGTVLWIPHYILSVHCPFDFKDFPVDEHVCRITYGSWTFTGKEINPQFYFGKNSVNLDDYQLMHPQWTVSAPTAERKENKYPCCPEIYPSLVYYVKITRVSSYYKTIFHSPADLIMVLMLMQFLVDRGLQRIVIGVAVMLASFVMMSYYESVIPINSSNVPLVVKHYLAIPIIDILIMILCIILQRISLVQTSMPDCLKKVLKGPLAFICCFQEPLPKYQVPVNVESHENDADPIHTTHDVTMAATTTDWKNFATLLDRLFLIVFVVVCAAITSFV